MRDSPAESIVRARLFGSAQLGSEGDSPAAEPSSSRFRRCRPRPDAAAAAASSVVSSVPRSIREGATAVTLSPSACDAPSSLIGSDEDERPVGDTPAARRG